MWSKVVLVLSLTVLQLNAQRSSFCRTPNKESGTCSSIYDCDVLYQVVNTRNSEQLRFLRESQCGYDRDPLVCCGTESNFRSTEVPRGRTGLRRTGSSDGSNRQGERSPFIPDRSSCGFQVTERILGGTKTTLDEFPWMALLRYTNSSGYERFACGASLISSRYVVTAAHCTTGIILKKIGRLSQVRLGEWNTQEDRDCVGRICNDPPQDVGIDETTVHPQYNDNSPHRYHDIALIRLDREVRFTDFIRPICLPIPSEESRVGENLIVAGWGKTESVNFSPTKLKLQIPIAAKSDCTSTFRTAGITLGSGQICAGGENGKDSCTGDSGGPLMRTASNDSAQWYLEGLVSFGAKCGSAGWPGIYTKVAEYTDWIHRTVRG